MELRQMRYFVHIVEAGSMSRAAIELDMVQSALSQPAQRPMDRGFIALLFLVSASGLALWFGRGTTGMPLLLCLHLGAVMALFATLPYGKFAHGIFRSAALLRFAVEKRLPKPIGAGGE